MKRLEYVFTERFHWILSLGAGVVLVAYGLVTGFWESAYGGGLVTGVSAGVLGYHLVKGPPERYDRTLSMQEQLQPKISGPIFCESCGQRMIIWKRQSGFEPNSGLPNFRKTMACPDWDKGIAEDAARLRVLQSGLGASRFGLSLPPSTHNCLNVVRGDWDPDQRHDHPPTEASLNCIRCVIDMEQAGILTRKEATDAIARVVVAE